MGKKHKKTKKSRLLFESGCAILGCTLWLSTRAYGAPAFAAKILYQLQIPDGFDYVDGTYIFNGASIGNTSDMSGDQTAVVWPGAPGNPILLSGTNITAYNTDGLNTVGNETVDASGFVHAALWSNTGGPAIDLNPSALGFNGSTASYIRGNVQVGGAGYTSGNTMVHHAIAWKGSASSAVDLNPGFLGITQSSAVATDGTQVVGTAGNLSDPFLWTTLNSNSAIDLYPTISTALTGYRVLGVGGGEQVGWARATKTPADDHAVYWSGTANSLIDLIATNPFGLTYSQALATNGTVQVGVGLGNETGGSIHAMWWDGTSGSVFDLSSLLPVSQDFTPNITQAFSVDSVGDVFGITVTNDQNVYAVEWSVVPEPTAFAIVSLTAALTLLTKRSRVLHKH